MKIIKLYAFVLLIAFILTVAACTVPGGQKASELGRDPPRVEVLTADVRLALVGILAADDPGTLVEDPGWLEYILDVENLSRGPLAVKTVKILNTDGRYLDSASTYTQIKAPPDPGEEVADHVARSATGIAVGQVIPFGGLITSTIFSAARAYGDGANTNAKRAFYLRVLKNVELAPGGKMHGSAFLPDITNAEKLIVEYHTQDEAKTQVEIPLPKINP